MLVSKIASFIIVVLGVLITNLNIDLSSLFVLQGALLGQAVPSYLLGLYHPSIMDRSLETGMCVGIILFCVLEFSSPELKKAVLIGPGFIGLIANVFTLFVVDFTLKAMGKVATPEPDKLTNVEICRIMENNINEPAKNPVLLVSWILLWFLPPWVFPSDGESSIMLGCPTWYIYQMLLHAVITSLLMYVIWSWKPHPPNKRKFATGEAVALKEAPAINQGAPMPVAETASVEAAL
jgi:hypothetical protein